MQHYYDILGVKTTTPQKEVKKKFRQLSMEHHPDRGGDKKMFNDLMQAYKYVSAINKKLDAAKKQNKSTEDFFKAMFGSKYGPYSRKN